MNKVIWKKLFFSFVILIILLLSFEIILGLGGYFYFYIYSNLDNPKIERDAFRIIFLGESTTEGIDVHKEDAYPAQVEKILQQKYPDKKIRAYNRGWSGIETTAILRNLDRNMIKYEPNLFIIMAGGNDNFFVNGLPPRLSSFYHRSKLYRLKAYIEDRSKIAFIDEDKGVMYTSRSSVASYSSPLSQVIINLDSMVHKVHSYGSEIWFAGFMQPGSREYVNPVLQKVSEENNITYVGDYPEVDIKVNRSLFVEDGFHPSEEGHRIIAEKIAERIINEGVIDRWQPGN